MNWIILSLLSAVFESFKDLLAKYFSKSLNEYSIAFSISVGITVLLAPVVLLEGIPEIGTNFFIYLAVAATLNALTLILSIKAIKTSELSKISPLYSLSPVFLLITAPLFLGELPTFYGLIGVVLVLLGVYFLNFSKKVTLEPLKLIFTDKGQRLVLLICFIWAISSNYYKMGVNSSSPIFFIFAVNIIISAILLPFILKKNLTRQITGNWPFLLLLGCLSVSVSVTEWSAAANNLIVYVLSIKRTSVLITIIASYYIFNEKKPLAKLAASIIMIIGVFLITLQ